MAINVLLDRIDTVPLAGNEESLTFEMQRWLATLVDSLNSTLGAIEGLLQTWTVSTVATPVTLVVNTSTVSGNAAQSTFVLPATAPVGSVVQILGLGAGGWVLQPAAGQTIKVITASAGTSITSAEQFDSITIACIVANTTWESTAVQSTGLIIV